MSGFTISFAIVVNAAVNSSSCIKSAISDKPLTISIVVLSFSITILYHGLGLKDSLLLLACNTTLANKPRQKNIIQINK